MGERWVDKLRKKNSNGTHDTLFDEEQIRETLNLAEEVRDLTEHRMFPPGLSEKPPIRKYSFVNYGGQDRSLTAFRTEEQDEIIGTLTHITFEAGPDDTWKTYSSRRDYILDREERYQPVPPDEIPDESARVLRAYRDLLRGEK